MSSMAYVQVEYDYTLQDNDQYRLEVKNIKSNATPGTTLAKLNERLKGYLKSSSDTSEFASERHLERFTQMAQMAGLPTPLVHSGNLCTESEHIIVVPWALEFNF